MFVSPPPTVPGTTRSAMVASPSPPTPESLVNRPALAALSFTTNQKGLRTFLLKFRAAVGSQYKLTLDNSITSGNLDPLPGTFAYKMHNDIYDMFVLTFKDNDDVLNEMTAHCGALGPKCIKYVMDRYDSSSIAVSVNNIGAIVSMAIRGPDDIDAIVAANKRFPELAFPDTLLSAVILLKLPSKYSTIKTLILQEGALPATERLADRLRTENDFSDDPNKPQHLAFAGIAHQRGRAATCFNCDARGHFTSECTKEPAKCDECDHVGHLTKHCLVRNDRALPENMTAAKKAAIEAKRIAYKARTAINATAIEINDAALQAEIDEDENFLQMLERLEL